LSTTEEISKGAKLAGRYRVLRRLGMGGMATVWLAEDERLGRPVAIKRLHTDAPKASLRRFRNEARLGATLSHPGFVAVYDTAVTEEGALIAMEYIDGTSLAELAGGRRMRPARALPILRAVAEALDHAHRQGVVHRDVKPGNILVGEDGVVKLADLGIARAVGATQITSEGNVVGTLPYMAPERLSGDARGGPEADIYALAAVAHELLAGRPPVEATTPEHAVAAPPPDPRRDWPGAPPPAAAALARGLDPKPNLRPRSAGEMVDELEVGLGMAGGRGRPGGELTAATRRMRAAASPALASARTQVATARRELASAGARTRRSPGWALAAASVAALLVAAAVMGFDGDGEGPQEGASLAGGGAEREKPKAEGAAAPQEEQPPPEPEPATAAELNDRGFELNAQGRYDEAIPLLQRAVAASEGSGDLVHAWALFNLGHALRMNGRPAEAIPILEQRLEIPNQTGKVRRELELAIAAAGGGELDGGEGEDDSGPGNGKAKGHEKDD